MREILFRGRTKDGKWHNGWYVKATKPMKTGSKQHEDWIVSCFSANGGWVTPLSRYAVDGDTVGQYTGVKDKNGVMIFEHDIVRYEWLSLPDEKYKRFENTVVIFTNYAAFLLHPISESKELLYVTSERENCYEIIGNIYDNPEILGDV